MVYTVGMEYTVPDKCKNGHVGHMQHRKNRGNSWECLQCKRDRTNAARAELRKQGLTSHGEVRSRRFTRTDEERFFEKVEVTGFCWLWLGAKTERGYANFWQPERKLWCTGHRWVYKHLVDADITSEQHLDHLCRVRHCVNPDHLEAVTNEENIRRGFGMNRKYRERTHCDNGHEFAGENLIIREKGFRRCRECRNTRARELYAEKKA